MMEDGKPTLATREGYPASYTSQEVKRFVPSLGAGRTSDIYRLRSNGEKFLTRVVGTPTSVTLQWMRDGGGYEAKEEAIPPTFAPSRAYRTRSLVRSSNQPVKVAQAQDQMNSILYLHSLAYPSEGIGARIPGPTPTPSYTGYERLRLPVSSYYNTPDTSYYAGIQLNGCLANTAAGVHSPIWMINGPEAPEVSGKMNWGAHNYVGKPTWDADFKYIRMVSLECRLINTGALQNRSGALFIGSSVTDSTTPEDELDVKEMRNCPNTHVYDFASLPDTRIVWTPGMGNTSVVRASAGVLPSAQNWQEPDIEIDIVDTTIFLLMQSDTTFTGLFEIHMNYEYIPNYSFDEIGVPESVIGDPTVTSSLMGAAGMSDDPLPPSSDNFLYSAFSEVAKMLGEAYSHPLGRRLTREALLYARQRTMPGKLYAQRSPTYVMRHRAAVSLGAPAASPENWPVAEFLSRKSFIQVMIKLYGLDPNSEEAAKIRQGYDRPHVTRLIPTSTPEKSDSTEYSIL